MVKQTIAATVLAVPSSGVSRFERASTRWYAPATGTLRNENMAMLRMSFEKWFGGE
jgi:hypothetical protein